jgi:hypothetical protein
MYRESVGGLNQILQVALTALDGCSCHFNRQPKKYHSVDLFADEFPVIWKNHHDTCSSVDPVPRTFLVPRRPSRGASTRLITVLAQPFGAPKLIVAAGELSVSPHYPPTHFSYHIKLQTNNPHQGIRTHLPLTNHSQLYCLQLDFYHPSSGSSYTLKFKAHLQCDVTQLGG